MGDIAMASHLKAEVLAKLLPPYALRLFWAQTQTGRSSARIPYQQGWLEALYSPTRWLLWSPTSALTILNSRTLLGILLRVDAEIQMRIGPEAHRVCQGRTDERAARLRESPHRHQIHSLQQGQ